MTTRVQKNIEQEYLELWESNKTSIWDTCSDYVNSFRTKAFQKFKKSGFPTTSFEDYQHTDLKSVFTHNYGLDLNHVPIDFNLHDVFKCDVPKLDTHLIFLVNGWYYKKNVNAEGLPKGVILTSFAKASKDYPELVKKYYNSQAGESKDPMVDFNTMYAQDGLFLYVPKGVIIEKAIQVINVLTGENDLLSNQRGLFIVEEAAQAKVLVCDHTMTTQHFVSNHVREIFVGKNAVLDYYLMENQHNHVTQIISSFIRQDQNSNVLSNFITLNNGVTRNNTYVEMVGEHAESHLYGMALTDKQQHIDNYSFIHHAKPNCTSTELFKHVLDGRSTGAFRGRILVAKDAQKTLAYQTNNNICMTPDAKAYTKPQLEIYADDVKCSHGATVGQLDESALFYLRSRGIDEREARLLLMFAFTHEVIENVRLEPLKERIHELVEKRFRGELSKCVGCVICNEPM